MTASAKADPMQKFVHGTKKMPTYEYKCEACGKHFDKFQSITAAPIEECPLCGEHHVKRLIGTGAGLIFKGSGFYITDYRDASYKEKAKNGDGGEAKTSTTEGKAGDGKSGGDSKSGGDGKSGGESKGGSESKSGGETKAPGSSESKSSGSASTSSSSASTSSGSSGSSGSSTTGKASEK